MGHVFNGARIECTSTCGQAGRSWLSLESNQLPPGLASSTQHSDQWAREEIHRPSCFSYGFVLLATEYYTCLHRVVEVEAAAGHQSGLRSGVEHCVNTALVQSRTWCGKAVQGCRITHADMMTWGWESAAAYESSWAHYFYSIVL